MNKHYAFSDIHGDYELWTSIKNYCDDDYEEYKSVYNDCFFEMRTALKRFPVNCCPSREVLKNRQINIFILKKNERLIGSVSIYENEIDNLVVAKQFQRQGYGQALLQFAISYLQKRGVSPIFLHVADWNQKAIKMYQKNNFQITKTETVN